MGTFDLVALLRQQEPLLRPLLGENYRIALHLPDQAVPVRGSEQMLAQAILNLVINARDAMANGGTITIDLNVRPASEHDGSPGKAILAVKDTGVGMDAETAQHAFEPFFTTKDGGKGTGLGLPLVARIVEDCGGTVALHSAPTRGTTATITLPLQAKLIATGPESGFARPRFEGRRAIVVEDEPALLELLRRALQEIGIEVHAAASGHEALAVLDTVGVVDLLITDLVMPEMSGPRLAALAQALQTDIAVVYVTGHTLDAAPMTTMLPRDAIVVKKPFPHEALAAGVARALERIGEPRRECA